MPEAKPVLLSVDDDQSVIEAILRTLEKLDVEVVTANSGKDGLNILKAREIDVVIADMQMPKMNGPEFLKEAAALQPHCRRIVLSDHNDADQTKAAINQGGVSVYLDKPWQDAELKRIVIEELELARLAKENIELHKLSNSKNEELQALNAELEDRVAQRTAELEHTNGVLSATLEELEEAHERMIDLVASIAAMPNPESQSCRKKLQLAIAIGEELGLDDEEILHLRAAVRLHRLGWVGLSREVKSTPSSKLDAAEREEFEKHPLYAEAVLLNVPKLKSAGEIVRCQHEAFNGQGFPNKSVGDGIPAAARILAVARDYFDLIAGRIETTEITPSKAVELITDRADTLYDPAVVKAFKTVLPDLEDIDLNLDEVGVRTMSLLEGMRLARDLTTDEGVVLLSKGSVLTEAAIATLLNLERRSDRELRIYVMLDSIPEIEADAAAD